MSGEIIEKGTSKWKIWGIHGSGLLGMVFSVIWLFFIVALTYVDSIRPSFFATSWDDGGLLLVIIGIVASFTVSLLTFILGRVQLVKAAEVLKDVVTAITTYLFYQLFPFNLSSEVESGFKVFLIFIVVVSLLSAVTNASKALNWNSDDDVSMHKLS